MMPFCSTTLKGTNLAAGHHLSSTFTSTEHHMLSSRCKACAGDNTAWDAAWLPISQQKAAPCAGVLTGSY